jgi:hypothetical protein
VLNLSRRIESTVTLLLVRNDSRKGLQGKASGVLTDLV